MKTTLNLPDDLMREVKVRAAREDRTLQDLITELLRRGLARPRVGSRGRSRRVRLPLVQCHHPASPDQEMTPERVAAILLEEESRGSLR